MGRVSNNILGIVNIIAFLLSIPILIGGIWLAHQSSTECDRFLAKPTIAVGVLLLLVSLAGIIGSCCRVTWVLWIYLFAMFLLIVLLFCFTVFAFVVTNKGAGKALAGKGYKEYRLTDYSTWLQDRVNDQKSWRRIRSCLVDGKVCQSLIRDKTNTQLEDFYKMRLSSIQAGCCKPPDSCNFQYVSPTNWTKTATSANPDCAVWSNEPNVLCFDCESCKAGVVDDTKRDYRKSAIIDVVFLVVLIIIYSVGCHAFRSNRRENAWK